MPVRAKKIARKRTVKRRKPIAQAPEGGFSRSPTSPVDQILLLQKTLGNRAVQRLHTSQFLQEKIQRRRSPVGPIAAAPASAIAGNRFAVSTVQNPLPTRNEPQIASDTAATPTLGAPPIASVAEAINQPKSPTAPAAEHAVEAGKAPDRGLPTEAAGSARPAIETKVDEKIGAGKPEAERRSGGKARGGGEEAEPVEAVRFEGASDQIVESFAGASASQMAASFPSLGSAVTNKLAAEQTAEANDAPELIAQSSGVEPHGESKGVGTPEKESAHMGDGSTEGEPPKQTAESHKDYATPPDNEKSSNALDRHEEGGFLSWFRNSFKSFLSNIATRDPGVNTSAGEKPSIDLSGIANPERAKAQRDEGQQQVDAKKAETEAQIRSNPGQSRIQPVEVNERKPVAVSTEGSVSVETWEQDDMAQYAAMPLPGNVRSAADNKMRPMLDKSLAKPRQEVHAATNKRDTEKKEAVSKAQKDAAALNQQANIDQNNAVAQNRKLVSDEQSKGLKEAQDKIQGFNSEVDKEQLANNKQVKERINKDQGDAAKKLDDAEKEAAQIKEKGESDARDKKKELDRDSENSSWWDRAVSAVKSAVKAVTKAIDDIFNWVREKVKQVIDAAKKAALDLIEAGRKWIIEKLDAFGNWLKDKVDKYLSAFPALAERINGAIDKTVGAAKTAVNFVADKLKAGVEALANALGKVLDKILSTFQVALKAAVQIYGAVLTGDFAEAAKIAFLAAAEIAGINPQPILNFIEKAGEKIKDIFKSPVKFFGNVAAGVKAGLKKFQENIKKHLIAGLIGWLTGALSAGGISLPEKFDLKGVFSLVLQILGLTTENIKAKLFKKLGPKAESIFEKLKKVFSVVSEFVTKGPAALWEWIKDSLSSLKETMLSGIRNWVITTVIKEGIIWVLSLLNPASAIVKAIKLLYDVVMFFVERYQQIVDFAKSVFNSVAELAAGQITKAATAVEGALARSVPVIISFLASLLGLGGIGTTIRNIITKIRKPIDTAIDKVVGWIVKKGKALLQKGRAAFERGKTAVKGGIKKGKEAIKAGVGKGKEAKDGKIRVPQQPDRIALQSLANEHAQQIWITARDFTGVAVRSRSELARFISARSRRVSATTLRATLGHTGKSWNIDVTASRRSQTSSARAGQGWISTDESGKQRFAAEDMRSFDRQLLRRIGDELRRPPHTQGDLRQVYASKRQQISTVVEREQTNLRRRSPGMRIKFKIEPLSSVGKDADHRADIELLVTPNVERLQLNDIPLREVGDFTDFRAALAENPGNRNFPIFDRMQLILEAQARRFGLVLEVLGHETAAVVPGTLHQQRVLIRFNRPGTADTLMMRVRQTSADPACAACEVATRPGESLPHNIAPASLFRDAMKGTLQQVPGYVANDPVEDAIVGAASGDIAGTPGFYQTQCRQGPGQPGCEERQDVYTLEQRRAGQARPLGRQFARTTASEVRDLRKQRARLVFDRSVRREILGQARRSPAGHWIRNMVDPGVTQVIETYRLDFLRRVGLLARAGI